MKCISCLAENSSSLSHCEKCGALLPVIRKRYFFQNKAFLTVSAIILICIVAFTLIKRLSIPHVQMAETISVADKDINDKKEQIKLKKPPAALKEEEKGQSAAIFAEQEEKKEVVEGWVIIGDPWGMEVQKFRAGLSGSGWLALPARACLAGNSWHFYSDSDSEAEINGGLWINGDPVGLWHISENAGKFDGPELAAWNERQLVSWVSLESEQEYSSIQLRPGPVEGFFVSSLLPDYINEIGVFTQNDKIVGWSFGLWLDKGYMWTGKTGKDLNYKTRVKDFYNITFANGREEKFAMTLALNQDTPRLARLKSFIDGFRMGPKLKAEDTPEYLLQGEIVNQIRVLVSDAVRNGEGSSVAEMLNSQTLKNIGDISLLLDVVTAIAVNRSYSAAVAEIEDSGRYIVRQLGREVPELNALHVLLYQQWLQSLVLAGSLEEGWLTYNSAKAHYPEDPYIHLLGVELVLLNGDWEEAERLIYTRDYPPAFQDRYELLVRRISELKGQEGKIVVRFLQGSGSIPVTAALNGTLSQKFMIDTGASMVTIPSSTANALRLETIHGAQRTLWTASGAVKVSEVNIYSIEIGGWVEYNVRAYVLDIPDRPGLGLLGLNYLGRFQMELKTDEGTLLLTPR